MAATHGEPHRERRPGRPGHLERAAEPLDGLPDKSEADAAPPRAALPLVDQPRRKASSTPPGGSPGPSSRDLEDGIRPLDPGGEADLPVGPGRTSGPGPTVTASRALSMRSTMVTTSRVGATPRGQPDPGSISKQLIPRSWASAALPSSTAVRAGSSTESTTGR